MSLSAKPAPARPASVVNCVHYVRDGQRRDIALDDIREALAIDDGSFVWIGLYEPDDTLLDKLQEEFGLHDLAVEDAHHAHQRPKLEAYGDSLFLAVNTAQVVDGHIRYGETHAFLGPRYLVTVRHGASLSYAPARARVERDSELLALGPSFGLYAVLDAIVDNYLPIVDEFKATLVTLEHDIFTETFSRPIIARLYALKRELTDMRVAVTPMQDVVSQLVRNHNPLVPEEVRLYFRDVLDHTVRVNDTVDVLRDMLGTALGVNQSLVTLAQGEVVKRLAGWAALLAAPTLIASWYGMNFDAMPELHGRWSYPILIGIVVTVIALLYRYLRKVRWL
ncbi:MAG: magnesium and cobalt transport protein CorA [Pseudomonadota bacterium]|nr:magnesium and cobalt transport protein CorA [Pseudomonadota bacterium]